MLKKLFQTSQRLSQGPLARQISVGFALKSSRFSVPKNSSTLKLTLLSLLTGGYLVNEYLLMAEELLHDVVAAEINDIPEGHIKEVKVGEGDSDKVIIANVDGQFYCVSSKCTHFGFSLSKGVLIDDKIICPFHAAAFSVITGYPEHGPALDGLHTYETRVEDGKIIVRVPKTIPSNNQLKMAQRDPNDNRKYLVVGGGVAGLNCAETLRQSGFTGEITIISEESDLPYDRTFLNKKLKAKREGIQLRSDDFFKRAEIEYLRSTRVTRIDEKRKVAILENGTELSYDKICLATGTSPLKSEDFIPGSSLKNVTAIREYADLETVQKSLKNGAKNIVIVGGSFIGMEIAGSLKETFKDEVDVTIVVPECEPYSAVLGPKVGSFMRGLAESKGVVFVLQNQVKSLIGTGGSVKEVELSNGSKLPADLVVLGTGVKPNSQIASEIVQLDQDGGIPSNPFLQVGKSGDVFCAGDVCSFPFFLTGQRMRVEHYADAMTQGVVAGWNMLGKMVPYASIPFFWTRVCKTSLRYCGYVQDWESIHVDGSIEKGNFLVYYIKNGRVLAAADVGRGKDLMIISEAMKMGVMPNASDIVSGKVTIENIKKSVIENRKTCKCMRKKTTESPNKA